MKRKEYFATNGKIKKSFKGKRAVNFGIPAFKEKGGKITCPFAKTCVKGCYAQAGAYNYPNTKNAYQSRYELTKSREFVATLDAEIKGKKYDVIRVHDSGDFYSKTYLKKWLKIAELNPGVYFYAYTKSVELIKNHLQELIQLGGWPQNFRFIFSYGGKQDHSISDHNDFHARVFESKAELKKAGYSDASENDSVAAFGKNNKIGLVYHGYPSRKWSTK